MAGGISVGWWDVADSTAEQAGSRPRTNWSGNYTYATDRVLEPSTVAEVQEAVRSLPGLRALGTRHSFNGIADSDVAQISTLRLNDVDLRPAEGTVRVGAGIRYGELAVQLDLAGFALHNMASLPHISVAGAVATGTHGSGLGNGNLATAVREVELVTAAGEVRRISRASAAEEFAGAVVSLGALGVVTHLTLAVEPRYEMVQTVYENLPFSVLEERLSEVMGAGYSVSLFTDWQGSLAKQVWIKQRVDAARLTGRIRDGRLEPAPVFFGATRATTPLHPLTGQPAAACTEQEEIAGAWYERLPHFRLEFTPSSGAELQSEYFVPVERGYEAVRALESLRDRITPALLVSELRAVAADDLWLSGQYGQACLAIHFTWKPDWEAVSAILPEIEAKLSPFRARPHWGKLFAANGEELRRLYPRMREFKALRARMDPDGKFLNPFLDDIFGSQG